MRLERLPFDFDWITKKPRRGFTYQTRATPGEWPGNATERNRPQPKHFSPPPHPAVARVWYVWPFQGCFHEAGTFIPKRQAVKSAQISLFQLVSFLLMALQDSQELLEVFDRKTRVTNNPAQRKSIHRVVPWNGENPSPIRHENMLTLTDDRETGLSKGAHHIQMVDSRNFLQD
jgi:hypothetical protein